MGNFTKRISERIQHVKISEGYCVICDGYGTLTEDHVPPKGSIILTKVQQRHITEVAGINQPEVHGVISRNGSKFKTICQNCNNNHLGRNDQEVARVCKELTNKINRHFSECNSIQNVVSCDVNAVPFARSMIGHILSATSVDECRTKQDRSFYFSPLKDFVIGDDTALEKTHDIFYWFFPYGFHLSAKFVGFMNNGHTSTLSLLSFFPIAFMISQKNKSTVPAQANRLQLNHTQLHLDLTTSGFEYSTFPFHGLRGNQISALNSTQAIISHPIGRLA
jgi:hypothetical protein